MDCQILDFVPVELTIYIGLFLIFLQKEKSNKQKREDKELR